MSDFFVDEPAARRSRGTPFVEDAGPDGWTGERVPAPVPPREAAAAPRRRLADWMQGARAARNAGVDASAARFPDADAPWSREDELMVLGRFLAGEGVPALAEALGREPAAVQRRLEQVALRLLVKQYRARL